MGGASIAKAVERQPEVFQCCVDPQRLRYVQRTLGAGLV